MKHGHLSDIRDANKQLLKLLGIINPTMQLVSNNVRINRFVCNSPVILMILGADLCDTFVQATRRSDKVVQLEDGITIPIFCSGLQAHRLFQHKNMGTPYGYDSDAKKSYLLIRASETINIPEQSQPWVPVHAKLNGPLAIHPEP